MTSVRQFPTRPLKSFLSEGEWQGELGTISLLIAGISEALALLMKRRAIQIVCPPFGF
jgi:hypothetical protein